MILECRYKDAAGDWLTVELHSDVVPNPRATVFIQESGKPLIVLRVIRQVFESGRSLPWIRCCKINDEDLEE
jgi:hypothetical protein